MKRWKIIFLICLYTIAFNLLGDVGDVGDVGDEVDTPGVPSAPGAPDTPGSTNLGSQYEAYTTINYYLNLYDFDKAEALIDEYLANNPEDPFILTEKAYLLKDVKNEHAEAATVLKRVKAIYPDYYYANYLLASLLFMYRDADKIPGLEKPASPLDEAINLLDISIKNNSQFFDSLFLMGAILSDKGKPNESNGYLEKALRVKQTPEPYYYIANNYRQLKDIENEIRTYKKILTYSPYEPRALSEISNYLLKRGDMKGAVSYLERLFLKYPDDKSISTEYLQALFGAREVEKFLEVSDTVDISGSPLLVFASAFFLGDKGRYTEALQFLSGFK
ncbi:MAG: Tetratricopeptide repeat protein [Acidobacteriota bacterium]|nr:Tetratricopeptide repeat protein [Acidobacteriota bacterium]